MKRTRRRKLVLFAEKLARMRARKLPDLPDLSALDNLMRRICTPRQLERTRREVARYLAAARWRKAQPLYRPSLNYLIDPLRDTDIPEPGGLFGKWLLVPPTDCRHDFGGDRVERTVTILGGGPLVATREQIKRHELPIDQWFCDPQAEFGGRKPCNVIRDDGLAGLIAVGQALDRMNPEGPPLIVKQGRSSRRTPKHAR